MHKTQIKHKTQNTKPKRVCDLCFRESVFCLCSGSCVLCFFRVSGLEFKVCRAAHGVTLLLVILILAALLSISLGIFNVVFTELRISGEVADSFVALYAADEAIEKGLYDDRDTSPLCFPTPGPGERCYDSGWINLPNGACYRLRADKTEVSPDPPIYDVTISATGEFPCGSGTFAVKRALSISYRGGGGE